MTRDADLCFTMSVVNEFDLASACLRHLRHAYPGSPVVLLVDTDDRHAAERWSDCARAIPHTRVVLTPGRLYAVENGGLVVDAHINAFLQSDAAWWLKIDPDTFVRRRLGQLPRERCFFGTTQGEGPSVSLQGGCIGGVREAVQELRHSRVLEAPVLQHGERSWAGSNPILLRRAREQGLVSFDFVLAWACRQLNIPLVEHPEIRSQWLAPPRGGSRYAITHPHKDLQDLDPKAPDTVSPLAQRLRGLLARSVPAGAVVAVISKGDDELLELGPRQAWHFPLHESGCYAGHHSSDSGEAIEHLEGLRKKGAQFLLIPAVSLWWLDHYSQFRRHMDRTHRCVASERDTGAVFELLPRRSEGIQPDR